MRGHVHRRGNTWTYVVDVGRDPVTGARRQRTKGGFATKREAEVALARIVGGVDTVTVATASVLTFGEFLEQWLNGHAPTVKATTAKCYRERLRWYVIPRLGHVKLVDLSPLHVQTLWADLLESGGRHGGLAPASVSGVRRALRKALNDAVAWGLIPNNPVTLVNGPRVEHSQMRTGPATKAGGSSTKSVRTASAACGCLP